MGTQIKSISTNDFFGNQITSDIYSSYEGHALIYIQGWNLSVSIFI